MKQYGRIEQINNREAKISVIRAGSCGNCDSCSGGCELKSTEVYAEAIDGLNVGDTVIFEMKSSKIFFAAFLVYVTPLIVLLLTYSVVKLIGKTENTAIFCSVSAMLFWFVCVHITDKKLKQYYKHTIISRIEENDVRI